MRKLLGALAILSFVAFYCIMSRIENGAELVQCLWAIPALAAFGFCARFFRGNP